MAAIFRQVVEVLKQAANACAPEYVRLECTHKAFVRIGSTEARCTKCEKSGDPREQQA